MHLARALPCRTGVTGVDLRSSAFPLPAERVARDAVRGGRVPAPVRHPRAAGGGHAGPQEEQPGPGAAHGGKLWGWLSHG